MPEKRPQADELLTLAHAARLTSLSESGLKVQCQAGRLSARKLGRDWVVTRGELHRYLIERQRARPRPLSPAYVAPVGMTRALDEGRVAQLAARAATDPQFVAYALARWQAADQLSEAAIATALGIHPDDLSTFQLYRRPDPAHPSYAEEVRTIAGHYGAKAAILDDVLRTYGH